MKRTFLSLAIASLAATANAGTITTDGEDLILSTKAGGLKIHNQDKSKSIQLGGRIQWDYDHTKTDSANSDDFDIRRARLYVKGNVGDWAYKTQFNVEGDGVEDLYIRYTGFGKLYNVTVGNQREPIGLEANTSSNNISVLERSGITELYTPGRSAGVQLHGKKDNWTYGVGVFEAEGDDSNDADALALTGRFTIAPIKGDNELLHFGLGYSNRAADDSDDEADIMNLEAAYVTGPLHVQAEYFDGEQGDMDVDGFYVQVGYVVTGETRPYKDGVFKRIKPAGERGAIEVVARFEDGDGKYSDIGVGTGAGSQLTLGVNWYATNNIRLGLSYMDGENDDTGEDGEEIRLRTQFTF